MALRDCSGSEHPDLPTTDCTGVVTDLSDCCRTLASEDEILLYEDLSNQGNYFYWLILQADETPLVVCNLEAYANKTQWQGRRADYLCAGWYNGDCYLAVIELRRTLVKDNQAEDKLAQLRQSITQIISSLPILTASLPFKEACHEPEEYKIIGVAIPTEHSKRRAEQTQPFTINGYTGILASLPNSYITDCRLSWSKLLAAVTNPS